MEKNHYIYAHYKPDGTVFYIGKGSGKRAWQKKSRSRYWNAVNDKYEITVKIWADGLSEVDAYKMEAEWIELYGRKDLGTGHLCNLTGGGIGGTAPSVEVRQKTGDLHRGNKYSLGKTHSEKTKKLISENRKGKGLNKIHNVGRKHSKETKLKHTESRLGKPNNRILSNTGKKHISFFGNRYKVEVVRFKKNHYLGLHDTLELALIARNEFLLDNFNEVVND